MGSLVDELERREAAARAEAERLRGQIAELSRRLAGVELVVVAQRREDVPAKGLEGGQTGNGVHGSWQSPADGSAA